MKSLLIGLFTALPAATALAGTDGFTAVTCQDADGNVTATLDLETDLEHRSVIGLRLQSGSELVEAGEITGQSFVAAGGGGYLIEFGSGEYVTFYRGEGYDADPERPDTLYHGVGDGLHRFTGCVIDTARVDQIASLTAPLQ
jgi:hypothetical protein